MKMIVARGRARIIWSRYTVRLCIALLIALVESEPPLWAGAVGMNELDGCVLYLY